jgi:hypothetical protein
MRSQCAYIYKCGPKKGEQCKCRVLPTIKTPNKILCFSHHQLLHTRRKLNENQLFEVALSTINSRGKKKYVWKHEYKIEKYDMINNLWIMVGTYPTIVSITQNHPLTRYLVKQIINKDPRLKTAGAFKITKSFI